MLRCVVEAKCQPGDRIKIKANAHTMEYEYSLKVNQEGIFNGWVEDTDMRIITSSGTIEVSPEFVEEIVIIDEEDNSS